MPSSVVAAMYYDRELLILKVVYTSGSIYHYLGVPHGEYDAMKTAFSKGTYLNRFIKNKYRFEKVK